MGSVVYQEAANNFTHADQTIKDRAIASVIYSPMTPTESKTEPSRVGEMYVQIQEGTTDKKLRMWVAVAVTGNKFQWEEATGVTTPLPDTVVRTDKVNDFQPWDQTIAGNQILSFVDGGALTPEQSKLAADYDGQFYIAVKTLSDGKKDVSVWIASGNQWLPLSSGGGPGDISRLAKLDVNNIFEANNTFNKLVTCKESVVMEAASNTIGDPIDMRQIVGARIKTDRAPIADAGWKAAMEGEITVYRNVAANETSVWLAIDANPLTSTANQWKMIWTSASPSGLPANVALTDKANTFVPLQKIGVENNNVFITGARTGSVAPNKVIVPLTFGEIYIRQIASTNDYEFWMAAQEADTDSWFQIFDTVTMQVITNRLNALEIRDDELNDLILANDADLDRMSATIGEHDSSITTLITEVTNTKGRVTNLETLTAMHEGRITALETHKDAHALTLGDHTTAIDEHDTLITNLQTRVTSAIGTANNAENLIIDFKNNDFPAATNRITQLETKSNAATESISTIEGSLSTLSSTVSGLSTTSTNHGSRLTSAEGQLTSFDGQLNTLTSTVSGLSSTSTSHGSRLTAVESHAGSVDSEVQNVKSDISGVRTRVTTAEGKITTLETTVGNSDTADGSLRKRVTTLETTIGSSDTTAGSLRKRIATLEAQVAALKTWSLVSNGHM